MYVSTCLFVRSLTQKLSHGILFSGYSLSDKDLIEARYQRNDRVWEGKSIPCATERAIFERLGLNYKEPHERNV